MTEKLSTDPYKGVRDFYPEDMAVQQHIFATWRRVCERYGYEEYNASILEPAELYRSKTSEEIVNEQTYTFVDRGDREVTLRPEMTPTVARMVAGRKRELAAPVRWFSIPNCFRYERPQRGRVREFWQLNADIFGVEGIEADVEIIALAHDLMTAFGASDKDFEIRINNRDALRAAIEAAGVAPADIDRYLSLLDKKSKMSAEAFDELSQKDFGIIAHVNLDTPDATTSATLEALKKRGITTVRFDGSLIRGFSYYTGTIFEVFDTNPDNPRALFGGGRYDKLLENFGGESLPAVGFGAGDVVMRDFLETHDLVPIHTSSTDVMICVLGETAPADTLATALRAGGINVAVYYGTKKLGDQIKAADKKRIPWIITVGTKEAEAQAYPLKNLASGKEETLGVAEIIAAIKGRKDGIIPLPRL